MRKVPTVFRRNSEGNRRHHPDGRWAKVKARDFEAVA